MSITRMREARILYIVIPAKAGIRWLFDGRNMDPRFRGDDVSLVEVVALYVIVSRKHSSVTLPRRMLVE